MWKKKIMKLISVSLLLILSGCGSTGDKNNGTADGGTNNGKFVASYSNDTLNISWKRTGDAVSYTHTELVVSNSDMKNYDFTHTNGDSEITIECTKEVYSGSLGQKFSCTRSNLPSYPGYIYLRDDEPNYIVERGTADDSSGEVRVATITSDGSGGYNILTN